MIEEEDESTSAFSNVANSILGGWVEPTAFNAEDRLGVVAPPLFQKRLQIIWSKVNIGREAIEPICDNENMSFATELAGKLITRYLLRSATEPADLLQAEARFNQLPIAGRSGNTA
ncbi:MAG TPA: hypothetical protein VFH39_03160 [Candidatus Saccharimonadales bacterium]|nr:hypothetical protein [Candidatus Saccharimonadales bacterium]